MIKVLTQANREKTIFWTLSGTLILLLAFYIFCINSTVRNVVSREKLENDAAKIALDISNREFQFISLRNSITIELAYTMGFKDLAKKTFIKKNSDGLVSYAVKGL